MLNEINKIVDWYRSLPSGYQEVESLIHARQELSGYLFSYTVDLGEVRKSWNYAQSIKETSKAKIEVREMHNGLGKADIIARANTGKELEMEKKLEGAYYSHKENVESIREVLNSMSQSIAIARDESNRRNMQNC